MNKATDKTITVSHFDKFHALSNDRGMKINNDSFMGKNKSYWAAKYKENKHLNNHPLKDFDARHYGTGCLADTVCCLKHTIIHELLGHVEEDCKVVWYSETGFNNLGNYIYGNAVDIDALYDSLSIADNETCNWVIFEEDLDIADAKKMAEEKSKIDNQRRDYDPCTIHAMSIADYKKQCCIN